jgi:hypothetical protein
MSHLIFSQNNDLNTPVTCYFSEDDPTAISIAKAVFCLTTIGTLSIFVICLFVLKLVTNRLLDQFLLALQQRGPIKNEQSRDQPYIEKKSADEEHLHGVLPI